MLDPNYQRPDPFFDAVLQRPHMTSEGGCDLPILYRDGSLLGMFYRVDPALAREVLPDQALDLGRGLPLDGHPHPAVE